MMIVIALASGVDGGMMRVVLFIMVLLAVVLILTGCAIALLTFYKQVKASKSR